MKACLLALFLAIAALAPAAAQTLPAGDYAASIIMGPVYLDGRYPVRLGDAEVGRLDLVTSPTGVVSGNYLIIGSTPVPVTGQITSRPRSVKLALRGIAQIGTMRSRVQISATLAGAAFRGTIQVGSMLTPCSIDVTGVAPLKVDYLLSVQQTPTGRITGAGTATVGRTQLPVVVRGGVAQGVGTLSVMYRNTFLRGSAFEYDATGFGAVRWTAQGFGALFAGKQVRFSPVPP